MSEPTQATAEVKINDNSTYKTAEEIRSGLQGLDYRFNHGNTVEVIKQLSPEQLLTINKIMVNNLNKHLEITGESELKQPEDLAR